MALAILDLNRAQYARLDDGTLADSLTIHQLRPAIKKMGLPVSDDAGKQDLILQLYEYRQQQELAARKHPANQGAAVIEAAKARA